jgi:hypothetical protein
MLPNRIQQHIKNLIHHEQVGFFPGMQGWFNRHKSINVTQHISRSNDKMHTILSVDGKSLSQNSIPFHYKSSEKLSVEGMFLNIKKGCIQQTCRQHSTTWKTIKLLLLKSGTRQGCFLSPVLFNIVLEFLA